MPARLGRGPIAWAVALHVAAIILLLGAARAPMPVRFAAADLQIVPVVETPMPPLVTDGEDQVAGASLPAPSSPSLASGGEAPTPDLEAAPDAGSAERVPDESASAAEHQLNENASMAADTERVPDESTSMAVAPPAPPPLPRQKPAPPLIVATDSAQPPPQPTTKPRVEPSAENAGAEARPDAEAKADIADPSTKGGGERGSPDRSGNRYLAEVRAQIERQRVYPPAGRGAISEGTAVFVLVIDRGGHLLTLQLSKSSGTAVLDDTGSEMIRRAAPLPPVPPEIPGEAVELEVALALFPR